jgi:hypothetical protein
MGCVSFRNACGPWHASVCGGARLIAPTPPATVTEDDEVVITGAQGEEVACHRATHGHGQRVVQPAHYQGLTPPVAAPSGVPAVVTFRQDGAPALDLATLRAAPLVEARPLAVYDQLVGAPHGSGEGWRTGARSSMIAYPRR